MTTIDELNKQINTEKKERIKGIGGIGDRQDQEFVNLEKKLMERIKNLEQMVKGDILEDEGYDLIRPYEMDRSAETMPQISGVGLSQHNKHGTQLSNHELHQIKSMHEKDHRNKVNTILDEPLGDILDKTINFLVYSFDGYTKKIYESELMNNTQSTDKGYYTRLKVHVIAMILFIRDDRNSIYIGLFMIFLSIIIYFINIITTAG